MGLTQAQIRALVVLYEAGEPLYTGRSTIDGARVSSRVANALEKLDLVQVTTMHGPSGVPGASTVELTEIGKATMSGRVIASR